MRPDQDGPALLCDAPALNSRTNRRDAAMTETDPRDGTIRLRPRYYRLYTQQFTEEKAGEILSHSDE